MPEIEKVDKGSPIGVNGPGQKRKQVYLLTIQYRDGTEKDVIMGSRRVAFVREGFLSKSNSDWMFYNTVGNCVATNSQKVLGICSKIGSTGTDGGFYIFEKPDATQLLLNGKGEVITVPGPFLCAHIRLINDGITPVLDAVKAFIDDAPSVRRFPNRNTKEKL